MVVVIGQRQALEPDVAVVRAGAAEDPDTDRCHARDVLLVVETVDPDSQIRDIERKPQIYAKAGIRHLWLVEPGKWADKVQATTYDLDPATRTYGPTGIHHDRLKLRVPFPVDIELTAYDRR